MDAERVIAEMVSEARGQAVSLQRQSAEEKDDSRKAQLAMAALSWHETAARIRTMAYRCTGGRLDIPADPRPLRLAQ